MGNGAPPVCGKDHFSEKMSSWVCPKSKYMAGGGSLAVKHSSKIQIIFPIYFECTLVVKPGKKTKSLSG